MENFIDTKISVAKKLFYGVGEFADACLYTVFYVYFLFFLTDVAKIDPALAGTISTVGILWDAITDPIIGSWSDGTKFKSGRRRPFMIAFAIPLGVSAWLLFSVFNLEPTMSKFYYLVMVIVFFTTYTGYFVPYSALAAEMTPDYDERTSIQSYKGVFISIGSVVGASVPMLLVESFSKATGSVSSGWSWMAATLGILSTITILISWVGTKNTELKQATPNERETNLSFLERYKIIFSNRPYRYVIGMYLTVVMGNTLSGAIIVYFCLYYLGLDMATLSLYFACFTGGGILFASLVNVVTRKLGKRRSYMLFISFWCVLFCALFLIRPGYTMLLLFMGFLGSIGWIAMWIITWSMISDVTEVDEWKSGQRREGLYFGFAQFIQKGGAALTMAISGLILSTYGYAPNVEQSAQSILGIRLGVSIYSAIPVLISVIICFFYPLSETKHKALREALAAREEGKSYSTEEFDDLV